MPFSARQGFFKTTAPIGYEWPGYMTSEEFTTEVTNEFTGSGAKTNSTFTPGVSIGYRGGILADNGNIYMCPREVTTMGVLDPSTDTMTTVSTSATANEYTGGVLAQNGNIYMPAFGGSSTILEFNPNDNSGTEITPTGDYYKYNIGGATLPSGKVMFQPRSSSGWFTIYDPDTNACTKASTKTLSENFEYMGCVPSTNGNVYVMPFNGQQVSYYNEDSNSWTDVDVSSVIGNNIGACQGGVTMADGRIVGVKYGTNGLFVFDPSDDSFYLDTYGTSWTTSNQAYIGGALGADGNVYFANFNLTNQEEHVFDTQANTVTRNTNVPNNRMNNVGAVASSNGNVYFIPNGGSDVAKRDTTGSTTYEDTLKSPHFNKGF
jgi:hypothetical protein